METTETCKLHYLLNVIKHPNSQSNALFTFHLAGNMNQKYGFRIVIYRKVEKLDFSLPVMTGISLNVLIF